MRRADAEFDDLEAALHVAPGVGNRLAMLSAERLGKLVHIAIEKPNELHEDACATLGVRRSPTRLRGGGGLDRGVNLFA